jgi:CheY-like chemotaxis protein
MTLQANLKDPQALVIEDHQRHAQLARYHLEDVGFEVVVAFNLIQASHEVRRMLDPNSCYRHTLILVDLKGVQPGRPDLEGSNWVAVLAREMQFQRLYPASIVAITGDPTRARVMEAIAAGCHDRVLAKPITEQNALWLRGLAFQKPKIPHSDVPPEQLCMIEAFQSMSARSLEPIFNHPVNWTPDDAYLLLQRLTLFPPLRPEASDDSRRMETLLHSLHGVSAARELLRGVAEQLTVQGMIHGEILNKFIDGYKRREIVKDFVVRSLYDDSHIYNCIKELPARVAECLKAY